MTLRIVLGMLAALTAATPVAAEVVSFNEFPSSITPVANPLVSGSATFSSANGLRIFSFTSAGLDRGICAHATNACRSALAVGFSGPVSNLSFEAYQIDTTGLLTLTAVTTSGTVTRTVTLARGFAAKIVDLRDIMGITSLVIDGTADEEGMIFDNFRFDLAQSVPEPTTWAMLLAGFGLMGGTLRARRGARREVTN